MISKYITELENAINRNSRPWFPADKELRKQANLRLGREIGYGLGMFDNWEGWAQTSYGRIIVKNSFDTIGVVVSNKEWITAIKEGIAKYHKDKRL